MTQVALFRCGHHTRITDDLDRDEGCIRHGILNFLIVYRVIQIVIGRYNENPLPGDVIKKIAEVAKKAAKLL